MKAEDLINKKLYIKGDEWIIKTLKLRLENWKKLSEKYEPNFIRTIDDVLDELANIRSIASYSEIADEIKENERKAKAWAELYHRMQNVIKTLASEKRKDDFGKLAFNQAEVILTTMDELLAQEEKKEKN